MPCDLLYRYMGAFPSAMRSACQALGIAKKWWMTCSRAHGNDPQFHKDSKTPRFYSILSAFVSSSLRGNRSWPPYLSRHRSVAWQFQLRTAQNAPSPHFPSPDKALPILWYRPYAVLGMVKFPFLSMTYRASPAILAPSTACTIVDTSARNDDGAAHSCLDCRR